MDGQADRLRLVGQRALDRLLDPPGGVGGELAALARVEALDGLHQPDVALADQVEQRQAEVLVVHRDLHDETQVGLDHVVAGGLVAAADALGEGDLLLDRQKGSLADLLEVELEVAALRAGRGASSRLGLFEERGRGVERRGASGAAAESGLICVGLQWLGRGSWRRCNSALGIED